MREARRVRMPQAFEFETEEMTVMSHFTGHLVISDTQSALDNTLLVKANIADPAQAVFAARKFLIAKGFGTGSLVTVTGEIVTTPFTAISMLDAVGTGP